MIGRREALGLLGAGAGAAVFAACSAGPDDQVGSTSTITTITTASSGSDGTVTADMFDDAAACAVAPEQAEGPFYIDVDSIRADIREDRRGVPLRVAARVLDVDGCSPVKDAVFEVWHCDAGSLYSGFESAAVAGNERYLRGAQVTNADGIAVITTIYPGSYPGRTVHIHVKVAISNSEVLTTQLYFDDELSDAVFERAPYNEQSGRDVTNENDSIFSSDTILTVSEEGDGYLGLISLAVSA